MKKETFADKLAKKTYFSVKFQQTWQVHEKAFGPILTPAFADDYPSRVHLAAALNNISRQEIKKAFRRLMRLQKACVTDADRAAWSFFLGLAFQYAGDQDNMAACYAEAGRYHHRFYLPYLSLAKYGHQEARFDNAEAYYRLAIRCLEETGSDFENQKILASGYANLASCLTMMHRFEEASAALEASGKLTPDFPQRFAAEAILCAALDQPQKVAECLDRLDALAPQLTEVTDQTARKILTHQHPQFCKYDEAPDPEKTLAFWNWFTENQQRLREQAVDGQPEEFTLDMKVNFPYMERPIHLVIRKTGDRCLLEISDYYMTALRCDLEDLLFDRPKELNEIWDFSIIH